MTQTLTIGSQANADFIVRYINDEIGIHELNCAGWSYVGIGATREVFRGPDGFVYKVDIDNEEANESEWDNYLSLPSALPARFSVPRMEMYYSNDIPVICAEYVEGRPACSPRDRAEYERIEELCEYFNNLFGLIDCYDYNVLVQPDGTLCMIDLGA